MRIVDGGSAATAAWVTQQRGPGMSRRSDGRPLQYRTAGDEELGPIYTGRRVVDAHGLPLGTIVDVVFDHGRYTPVYLVVDPGIFRRSHYVPASGARLTVHGEIKVAWDRDWIRLSSPVNARSVLTAGRRREVDVHYSKGRS